MNKKIIIRRATIKDVRKIAKLVGVFAREGRMLFRKEADIVLNLRDFFVAVKPRYRGILGCVSLHIYTDRLSEIKALAVKKRFQTDGVGRKLVQRCIREAKDLDIPKVFALTYVPSFFQKQGFVESDKNLLPYKIWEECEKCSKKNHCTENCLVYSLKKNSK